MQIDKSEVIAEAKAKALEFESEHPILAGMAVGAVSGLVASLLIKLLPALIVHAALGLGLFGYAVRSAKRNGL